MTNLNKEIIGLFKAEYPESWITPDAAWGGQPPVCPSSEGAENISSGKTFSVDPLNKYKYCTFINWYL